MDLKHYIHPTDRALTEKILGSGPVKSWMDRAFADGLDQVCAYVYSASLPAVADERVLGQMDRACGTFEISTAPLYRRRTYDYEVACAGYHDPAVLVPVALLERGDEDVIRARLYAAAGAVAAGHPRLSFLLWAVENMSGGIDLPFAGQAIRALLYEWNRIRYFTLDRAVLLATGDYALALKNILYGVVPFEMLDRFRFGDGEDTFLPQVERFLRREDAVQLIGTVYSFFQDYAWLPRRYEELRSFCSQMKGGAG